MMSAVHLLEYFGVVTGLLYLLLEIKQHRSMWVVGFLTSLVYVAVFFHAKVYADMGLNMYYVAISIYGFRQWAIHRKVSTAEEPSAPVDEGILYRHLTWRLGLFVGLALAIIFGAIWYVLNYLTDSPIPVGDAFTTAVGIVATWMLARRIVEHWIFWVVANGVSVYLFYLRGLYPTTFLYICYTLLAIAGWYTWTKNGTQADNSSL